MSKSINEEASKEFIPVNVYFDDKTYRVLLKYRDLFGNGDDYTLSKIIVYSMRRIMLDYFAAPSIEISERKKED